MDSRLCAAVTLRICHVITQLELGGAQRNTLYTVGHLSSDRFEPCLITGRGGLLDSEATAGQWQTIFLNSLRREVRPWSDATALIDLYQNFRRWMPHVVHTHSSKAGILGRIAAYAAGVPVIIHTFHGFGFTPVQPPRTRNLYIALERFCARLSTHLIFVSEDNRQEAMRLGIVGTKPTSLIRSGIALAPVAPLDSPIEGLPTDAWTVISVANFKPQKNPMDLVKVAELVLAKDTSIRFVLIGDGELRAQAEEYVKSHHLSNQVLFFGLA